MTKVFIDGSAGTTGLRIHERLSVRKDIELITLPDEHRKDDGYRRDALNSCDIAITCLPDAAAIGAADMIDNPAVRLIDASTAHRTAPGWAYGFPELSPSFRKNIAEGSRVACIGCHAAGFISLVYPLAEAGIISGDSLLCCHSLTGYTGGGKSMIADYESADRTAELDSPRQYGISQQHKHLREMQAVCGLKEAPVFCPIVADFPCGMVVTVPLFGKELSHYSGIGGIKEIFKAKYSGSVVKYVGALDENGFIASNSMAGNDGMEITVCGNDDRILLISRFDNLGKGASGCAVQCMNIMLGIDETTGLVL